MCTCLLSKVDCLLENAGADCRLQLHPYTWDRMHAHMLVFCAYSIQRPVVY